MPVVPLRRHRSLPPAPGPLLVVVMDGMGIGRGDEGDAIHLARTPTLDMLARGSWVPLNAHGTHVGMPSDADMGNSEVGHNALGAGRVFDQGAKLVDEAVRSGALFDGAVWTETISGCVAEGSALHFIGLLSDGNVHSHEDHLHALLRRAAADGCRRLFVHPLLDGRDVSAVSALTYIDRLEAVLGELRSGGVVAAVASGGGRMVTTMDRYEADWSVVERGWNAHVHGEGRCFPSARAAIEAYRDEQPGISDQFLPPFVVTDGEPLGPIRDGDGVILFNFRGDRAIEVSRAFTEASFDAFDRGGAPDVRFAGMMEYDGDLHVPPRYLVQPPAIDRTMGEYLAASGASQWACSETQKYGHVTYFWNGNRSGKFDDGLEEYLEIRSDVLPFEQRPWMKAAQITDAIIDTLKRDRPPELLRVNYANGDMVGHTGSLDATVLAVETVDLCLARLLPVLASVGGTALVTADHGNADQMFQIAKSTGAYTESALTAHTLNPVPLYLHDPLARRRLSRELTGAGLANVAATALELMGWEPPDDYRASLLAR
jgi:2,3-bisphosphoglycerate-independent phosphoglycerate mutase